MRVHHNDDATGESQRTDVAGDATALPRHDELTWLRRTFEFACIAIAMALLVSQVVRLVMSRHLFAWWLPLLALGGIIVADFVSGLIHWTADTWGSETMPLLGRRFLRPFRVHHVNPDDFLRRTFLDTNGDVAMIVIPFLSAAAVMPLDAPWGRGIAVFCIGFALGGLPTNQVHQWAHMPDPPRPIRILQTYGFILSREAHAKHHRSPYAMNYCIATGWCNRILTSIDFFRRLERCVTRWTGIMPRLDDQAFFQVPLAAGASNRSGDPDA